MSDLLENDQCSIFLLDSDGETKRYQCLAIANLDDDSWIAMNTKYIIQHFHPDLEVQKFQMLEPQELSHLRR